MATATFFGANELEDGRCALAYDARSELASAKSGRGDEGFSLDDMASLPFPWDAEFVQQQELLGQIEPTTEDATARNADHAQNKSSPLQYCLLSFHTPVIIPPTSVVLGSRLDTTGTDASNIKKTVDGGEFRGWGAGEGHCRIAFHGRLVAGAIDDGKTKTPGGEEGAGLGFGTQAGQLKLFSEKLKTGVVFRVGGGSGIAEPTGRGTSLEVFGKDLFKKETNMAPFVGMILHTEVRGVKRFTTEVVLCLH